MKKLAASVVAWGLLLQAGPARADKGEKKPAAEAGAYITALEQAGLVDKTLGSAKRLEAAVRRADERLTADEVDQAIAELYAIVEGTSYEAFTDTEVFQDAEYRLGVALAKAGAAISAKKYLMRALGRGKDGAFYLAALRATIDLCLRERLGESCKHELLVAKVEDQNGELAYLSGRVWYEAGKLDDAEVALAAVTPQSRFYTASIYLRGVIAVKKRNFKEGRRAFCIIADVKDGDRLRFVIDGRYFQLRDLARLGLGRIAHEERNHSDAFYHYFLVPTDSPELETALFEGAFAAFEGKEHAIGARLAEEFLRLYPSSGLALEAKLLLATLKVRTCRFAEADKELDEYLVKLVPLYKLVTTAQQDASLRRSLALRLLGRDSTVQPSDDEKQLVRMLQRVPSFLRLRKLAQDSERSLARAAIAERGWQALEQKVAQKTSGGVQPVQADEARDAIRLQQELTDLSRAITGLRRRHPGGAVVKVLDDLERRRAALADRVAAARTTPVKAGDSQGGLLALVRDDRAAGRTLAARAVELQARLDNAAADLVESSLAVIGRELQSIEQRAQLAKIDAVVRWKRQLEKEVEDIAAGRFPKSMMSRLHVEGLLADDEEFWPPEPEKWADEYEDYK